jgi:hypothetical protein
MAERRRVEGWIWALAALTAAGAALRFSTLSLQSFWLDEAVTHRLLTRTLGGMLGSIPHSESTPPLYYVLAWVWVRVFGAGEAGLRSLSALFGTATIVLLALIARRLAGNRAGLAAAALAAANPLLIWYSQEARAYALLVALCALSLWCLLREDWRGWALASAAALATHYFALFIVVPQLGWLVWRRARDSQAAVPGGDRKAAAWSAVGVAVVAAALLPLAIVQAGGDRAAFIRSRGLGGRIVAVPKQFLIGYATPHQTLLTIAAVALAVALAVGLRRSERGLLGLAAIAVGLPIVLALGGADYLITRNVIAAIVPLVVVGAVAATRSRAGPAVVAGLCAIGIVAFAGVEGNGLYQRDDWRGVARALGPATLGPRAVVLNPPSGAPALEVYTPLRTLPRGQPFVTREIDVIDLQHNAPPPPSTTAAIPGFTGFTICSRVQTPEYEVVRYCAPAAVTVAYFQLVDLTLVAPRPVILTGG